MLYPDKPRSCFIIGPMKDGAQRENTRLRRLAKEVIQPLLDEIERRDQIRYIVRTPWDLGGNHIMNDVIYHIDRADLVVADLTDSNPNVFYELGLCHALGRACIAVLEDDQTQTIQFDLRAYRVFKINLNKRRYGEARDTLRETIETAHRNLSDFSNFENPVIDFFRAPITYISPAFAIAHGYYQNFVKPVVEAIIRRKGGQYLYDIGVAPLEVPRPGQLEDTAVLSDAARRNVALHVIIPGRISLAKHNYADRFRGYLPSALVEGDGRSYTCWARPEGETLALVDLPTTIRVMEDAVNRRMRYPNVRPEAPEWREIEQQELERFTLVLQMLVNRHEDNPDFAQHVRILRYDPERPGTLAWMRDILPASAMK
jgi:nucleoside 2-deoxyribosyltransferase